MPPAAAGWPLQRIDTDGVLGAIDRRAAHRAVLRREADNQRRPRDDEISSCPADRRPLSVKTLIAICGAGGAGSSGGSVMLA